MDPQSVVKIPLFDVSETPLHSIASSQNSCTVKDISFSTYLKPKDPTQNHQENGNGCTTDDAEISIFDAHKYFSESNDPKDLTRQQQQEQSSHDLVSVSRLSSVSSVEGYPRNFRTASSEASWNSQTGLLTMRSVGVLPSNGGNKKRSPDKKWFLGRTCCCSGEKSVQVKEVVTSENRGAVVLIDTASMNDTKGKYMYAKRDQGKAPQSLEIHQGIDDASSNAPLQRRISASGRPFLDSVVSFTFPILSPSPNKKANIARTIIDLHSYPTPPSMDDSVDDDVGSDASSDLFEIESFSTQTTPRPGKEEDPIPINARRLASTSSNGINNSIRDEVSFEWSITNISCSEARDLALFRRKEEEGQRVNEDRGSRSSQSVKLSLAFAA